VTTEELVCNYAESLHPNADDLLMLIGYLAKYVRRSEIDRHYGIELKRLEVDHEQRKL
jgi:hypothetical protein